MNLQPTSPIDPFSFLHPSIEYLSAAVSLTAHLCLSASSYPYTPFLCSSVTLLYLPSHLSPPKTPHPTSHSSSSAPFEPASLSMPRTSSHPPILACQLITGAARNGTGRLVWVTEGTDRRAWKEEVTVIACTRFTGGRAVEKLYARPGGEARTVRRGLGLNSVGNHLG